MKSPLYYGLTFFVWLSHRLKRAAIHLTRWTGKSQVSVHPKHLLKKRDDLYWYLEFLEAKDVVLDVGCGSGMHSLRAANRANRVIGIELNPTNLEGAREMLRIEKMANVEFIAGDVTQPMPFDDRTFDKILCFDVLEHVHERIALLREMRRVLKPSGTMLLSVPSAESRWRHLLRRNGVFSYSDPDHKIEYTRPELEKELAEGGFHGKQWLPNVYDTPWVGFIDVVGGLSLGLYERLSDWKRLRARQEPTENIGFWVLCQPSLDRQPDLTALPAQRP